MTKAYSYIRFSTPDQQRGDSFRRQSEMAARYAAAHGLELDTSLSVHDLGVSAFRGANVETGALGAFLAAVQAGDVAPGSVLLVEALDRISRKSAWDAAGLLRSIVNGGIDVVTLADGKRYTQANVDGFDIIIAMIVFIRGNEESETKSRRLKAAWSAKRAKAGTTVLTSRVPGWLEVRDGRTTVIRERAKIVKRIFAMFLAGTGKAQIAGALNAEGIKTFGRAGYWHRTYIHKILTSPAVTGIYTPHAMAYDASGKQSRVAQDPVPGYYPAVIDEETYDRAQALVHGSEHSRMKGSRPVSLLAGLARCPVCGGTMTRVTKGTATKKAGQPKLVCVKARSKAGCKAVAVRLTDLEQTIYRNADALARSCPSGDADLQQQLDDLNHELFVAGADLEQWTDTLAQYPSQSLATKVTKGEARLNALRQDWEALQARAALAESKLVVRRAERLGRALAAMDPTTGNAALRECFSSIVVDYPDGSLRLNWRHGGDTQLIYDAGFQPIAN